MYVVETAEERIAKATVQRRRDDEAERRERIFNDNLRIMGVSGFNSLVKLAKHANVQC